MKKKIVFGGVGVLTVLMCIYKAMLISNGTDYFFPAWIENIVIHIGIAILLGGLFSLINKTKFAKGMRGFVTIVGAALTGAISRFSSFKWLCFIYGKHAKESEMEYIINEMRSSEIPYLFAMVSVCVFIITILALIKAETIKDIIDEDKKELSEYDEDVED